MLKSEDQLIAMGIQNGKLVQSYTVETKTEIN